MKLSDFTSSGSHDSTMTSAVCWFSHICVASLWMFTKDMHDVKWCFPCDELVNW